MRAPDVPLLRRREDAIERGEETAKESARRVLRSRPENQRALRGLVGERVHHREEDGERDGESELPVERSGDAEDEARRDEDTREHERDADERAAHLVHGGDRGVVRREALVDLRLHGLDDDDRVVHNESDRQNEAEERERVDREAEHRKEEEGADQGHRDSLDRDPRRPKAPEEDEHDQEDEPDRLGQGDEDLLRALGHGDSRVERQVGTHVRGKTLREACHGRLHAVGHLEGVRAGDLVEREQRRRRTVGVRLHVVVLAAELDAGDVLETDERAVGVGADDDVAELLGIHQAPARADGVCQLLSRRRWLAADLARGIHDVLCRDRVHEVGDREAHVRERVGRDPHAHGVV